MDKRTLGELQEKYPNMYIAVKDGKVLVANREYGKARDTASKVQRFRYRLYLLLGEPLSLRLMQDRRD